MKIISQTMRSSFLTFCFIAVVVFVSRGNAGDSGKTQMNIWQRVKAKASKADDRKAIWRELKKLNPDELLRVGEQFCQKKNVRDNGFAFNVTVNAIVSYHAEKTSYHETSQRVVEIIKNSNTAPWIFGAVKWSFINDHWRMIRPEDFQKIGRALAKRLNDADISSDLKETLLELCVNYHLCTQWDQKTLDKVYKLLQRLAKSKQPDGKDISRKLEIARQKVARFAVSDRFKRVEVKVGFTAQLRPGAAYRVASEVYRCSGRNRSMRLEAVKILSRLGGREGQEEACKKLLKWYEREPDGEVRKAMIEAVHKIDPTGKLMSDLAKKHDGVRKRKLWMAINTK